MTKTTNTQIKDLKVGDLVDLYGDKYADPKRYPGFAWEFEYAEVIEIERETPECIRVDFNGESVGFPPDHIVEMVSR